MVVETLTLYAGRQYHIFVEGAREEAPPDEVQTIVHYSQRDNRWTNVEYAPGWTIGAYGCLVTCIAMITSLAYAEPFTPAQTAHHLRQAGCFHGGLLSSPGRIPRAFERLRWGGYLHWRTVPARLDLLAEEVRNYGATIAEVAFDPTDPRTPQQGNQHFVVVIGVTYETDPPNVMIVDPWTGERALMSQSAYAWPMQWSAERAIFGARLVRAVREAHG